MNEIIGILFIGLILMLWLIVIIDLIINFKTLNLRPVYRFILIIIPVFGPIIYLSTKKREGNSSLY
tara:strand:+ start:17871 stop:18068 length:198 start_codon:yes stop_codon:yes gene_type:complete